MGLKFFVVALVAVLSLQGFANAKYINVVDERGIVEDIGKVVEEIKAAVQKTIVEGITAVKHAFDQVMDVAQHELNKAMAIIQKHLEETLADIKEFEELAKELGYDIHECVEEQIPRINELVLKTQNGITVCVSDLAHQFQNMYEELLKVTSDAYEKIYSLVVEFDECKDWTCRGNVAKKLVQEMNEINSEVRTIVDESIGAMQQELPTVVKCIKGQLDAYNTEMLAIVADIKKCVESAGETQIATRSIHEEIAKLIEQLHQALKDVVEEGVASLKKAYEEIVAFAEELAERAQKKIEELAGKLHKEIEEIKEKAKELNIDIQDCLNEAIPKIEALITKTENEINTCIENTLGAVKEIYDKVVALTNEVKDEVRNLLNAVTECKDIKCFIEAIRSFGKVLKRIHGEIKDLIASSSVEIQKAFLELAKCSKPSLENYVVEMQKIAEEFKKCFDDKQQ